MSTPGKTKEFQLSLRGTPAHGSHKSRELSLRVSCAADRRCSSKTRRCYSCLTHGFASLMKPTSLILFRYCAEACRVSTQLRAGDCSIKFSEGASRARRRLSTSQPNRTQPSRRPCPYSTESLAWEIPHDLSERALAALASGARRR